MVGRSSSFWALLLVAGCGGGATSGAPPETGGVSEATGADSESAASEGETPGTTGATDDGEPAAAAEGGATPGAETASGAEATTLSKDELQEVLQSVLSDPQLLDGLHLKKPGRAPLKVSGPGLPAKLKVVVGSHDVKVVDEPSSKKSPVLVFTKIERSGDQTRVHYRFEVEKLEGRATLYLKGGHWQLAANRVLEK